MKRDAEILINFLKNTAKRKAFLEQLNAAKLSKLFLYMDGVDELSDLYIQDFHEFFADIKSVVRETEPRFSCRTEFADQYLRSYYFQHHYQINTIAVHNPSEILEMITLPKNIVDLAADTFWTAWAFMIGHELFHLTVKEKLSALQEEQNADAYGYMVLLHMMQEQKEKNVPENIKVFYEYQYLSPVMLFTFFELLDEYRKLSGFHLNYTDHPAPEKRKKHILELSDTDVPDDFDTEQGNELLNIFLDAVESLKAMVYQGKVYGNGEDWNNGGKDI